MNPRTLQRTAPLVQIAGPRDGAMPPGEPPMIICRQPTDGSVCVGVSPDTGRPLFVMPVDLEGFHTWNAANDLSKLQTFGGHADWRLPTKLELPLLYRHRDLIRAQHRRERDAYWSRTGNHRNGGSDGNAAWCLNFGTGAIGTYFKAGHYRARLVRSC